MKNWLFIVIAIIIIIYIVYSIRKNNLSIKTSFLWFSASLIMLILAIFPYSLDWLAKILNISYPPALFLTLCIVFLVIINFNFSKKISSLNEKLIDLAQELTIIKAKVKNEKKH